MRPGKLTPKQKVLMSSMREQWYDTPNGWYSFSYATDWRTAKSLEARGFIEILEDEATAAQNRTFGARLTRWTHVVEAYLAAYEALHGSPANIQQVGNWFKLGRGSHLYFKLSDLERMTEVMRELVKDGS